VIETLVQVKGIGRWTAEMFLMFSLGREDIFSHGDLGLRRGLEKLYCLKDPSRDDVEAIVTKWSPYKSYGSVALWHSLE
jgi:DNA-3-methyladenine glycosylase II